MDCLDQFRRKYSLVINVDKTKVMASDGIACRILIQNKELEQVDTFQYLGYLITKNGEIPYQVKQGERRSGHHCRKYGKVTAYRIQRFYN